MSTDISSERFVERLEAHRSPEEAEKYLRYFKTGEGQYGEGDVFMGVRMGQVFALAKEFIDMPLSEIEKLLESKVHEVRAGGLSIMDKQARSKKMSESRRKDRQKLLSFLNKHAASMPRTALRYAIEHLDKEQRGHYMNMKKVE
jgi:hypothetical protein